MPSAMIDLIYLYPKTPRPDSGHCMAVVNACLEMAQWEGPTFGGVDDQYIPEYFLAGANDDFSVLHPGCETIGMDCSSFVFYHADLGPTNIIVEDQPNSRKIGIIDFEISGYFPRDWVRIKFRLSSGMDLSRQNRPVAATLWHQKQLRTYRLMGT